MLRTLILSCCYLTLAISVDGQATYDDLNDQLLEVLEKSKLPGFAVSIIHPGRETYQAGFGFADYSTQRPFTTKTITRIASVSKTFIGLALLQLAEEGELDLDEDVNTYLPFSLQHPEFPEQAISLRHLATHTSGINDLDIEKQSVFLNTALRNGNGELVVSQLPRYARSDFRAWQKNLEIDLERFLGDALSRDGACYSNRRFYDSAPGNRYQYSNLGAAVAALVVEQVSGVPFSDYIEEKILMPLGLNQTGWNTPLAEGADVATPYFQKGEAVPDYASSLYPAGGLYSNLEDLSHYLHQMMTAYDGQTELLTSAAQQQMHSNQLGEIEGLDAEKNSGIFWEINGDDCGHNGGNYGTIVLLSFERSTGIGRIFLTNISSYTSDEHFQPIREIWQLLKDFSTE